MKWELITLLAVMVLVLIACAQNTSTNLSDRPAYIKFLGETEGVTLVIDNQVTIVLNPENKQNLVYEYPKGVHLIELRRNGELILKTNIVLENGKTTEVIIP